MAELISLFDASKRLGLRERSETNWTPLLRRLCQRAGIEVHMAAKGSKTVPSIDRARLASLESEVRRHFDRPRLWPRKRPKSAPPATSASAENPH